MAEYRDLAPEFARRGVEIVAISADDVKRAAAFKREARVPFVLLSDPRRDVIVAWDLLNPELGGLACTATFVLGSDLTIEYAGVDPVTHLVPAAQILKFLEAGTPPQRASMWSLASFLRVVSSILRHGWLTPRPKGLT